MRCCPEGRQRRKKVQGSSIHVILQVPKQTAMEMIPANHLIQQIAVKMAEEILDNLAREGMHDLGQTARELLCIAKAATAEKAVLCWE